MLAAAIGTEDTALVGTGLESIALPDERAAVLGRLLDHIHGTGDQAARYVHLSTDTVGRWSSSSWARWRFGMTASGSL
jgi:hypothetical protein